MFWYHFVVKTSAEIFLVKLTRQKNNGRSTLEGFAVEGEPADNYQQAGSVCCCFDTFAQSLDTVCSVLNA